MDARSGVDLAVGADLTVLTMVSQSKILTSVDIQMPLQPRKYERYMIPARLKNEGGFSNETIYRVRLANGQDFEHIGFTSYTFDQNKKRSPDAHWLGEKDGYVEVIVHDNSKHDCIIVEPPQVHNCEWSGFLEVPINDLKPIPRSEWNDRDSYGVYHV